ncbi:E1 protein [Human papillomavirus 116]|uniref:Replication protein E1 n=1 Tax=Human papillomavirus 116 TaxID=915428 RepID=C7B7D4_9PAPI|nr:E1 protein [Human papillomavirus 116]ACT76414.1 E1 protein [Human papillomavirus 116]
MADASKGIDSVDDSSWFIVNEADCMDDIETLDTLFDESDCDSTVSNLIDDENFQEQGNSLALFNIQCAEECDKTVSLLKRKYAQSPQGSSVAELSPRLEAVKISPEKERQSKRRLFQDSGLGEDEAELISEQVEVQTNENGGDTLSAACNSILNSKCKRSLLFVKCETLFGVSYNELTRQFKSHKSCCENWIVFVYAAGTEVLESSKVLLQQHCENFQVILCDFSGLYVLQFKHGKNRETVERLFCNILHVTDSHLLSDPPRSRSVPAALFFFKRSVSKTSYVYNNLPAWVTKLTQFNHQVATQPEAFELSKMIQWAYDNRMTEEAEIAYGYALLADEDTNAAAFLKSNVQLKYVRDCCTMVKLYFRQEMREMSISQWIWKCCNDCEGEADWKLILNFLKFQNINVIQFLTCLRTLCKRIPKKNCILFYGPPDTGKSFFAYSLVKFLQGKILSFVNKTSNFWLQPLLDCKFALLDDVTYPCWQYIDQNMRGALDGNTMCVDAKHRVPQQIKLPPLILTSNIDVVKEESLQYLHSRLMCFEFANKLPFDTHGIPVYNFTNQVWKCFFQKLSRQLDLEEENIQHESIRSDRTFRCIANSPDEHL